MEEAVKKTLKVNGIDVSEYREFAYDGCHKIYLMPPDDEKARQKMIENGYQMVNIQMLAEEYINSCSLRFIDKYDLEPEPVVKQCEKEVVFEGFDKCCLEEDDNVHIEDGKITFTAFEERSFVVRLTVKPGTSANEVMRILEDRAYECEGVEYCDYVEQEEVM